MNHTGYRYRPVLFFMLAYLFTWIFWIPAIFVPENPGTLLMLAGLIAPAVVFQGLTCSKKTCGRKSRDSTG